MWSPSCVLEGTAKIDGKEMDLILYTGNFSGAFQDFGRSSFALLEAKVKRERYIPKKILSSLINYEGHFYRLKTYGSSEKNRAVRVVLEKDTSPRGDLAVAFTGKGSLKAKLNRATITGNEDNTIRFDISGEQSQLPEAGYKLLRGYIGYGDGNGYDWQVNFSEGPEIIIDDEKLCRAELGAPEISVRAIEEKDRYRGDVEEKKTFSKGTKIYLTPVIKGKVGETYSRYSRIEKESGRWEDIEPTIKIVDSEDKEIASATMEYG
jgi:hypothetical protein